VTVAIPTKPEELEAMLSDASALKNIAQEGKFTDFVKAYAQNVVNKDKDLSKQIENEVQLGLQAFLKENKAKGSVPLAFGGGNPNKTPVARGGKGEVYNKRAPGAGVDNARDGDGPLFADAAEFFQCTWDKRERLSNRADLGRKLERLQELQNSYGTVVPADGGFLVPESLRSELLELALESAVVRPRATVIPMTTARVGVPYVDSTTNVGSVLGGVVAYWTEEGGTLVESQGKFAAAVLDAKKLTAYAEVPSELMADAPAFMGYFDQTFPKALSFFEDLAFMSGNGVGQPLGWLNNSATVTVTAEAGQGVGTIVWENIVKMYARMLPSSLASAVWVVDIAAFPQLATMALNVGVGGSAVWLNNGVEGPPATILGRPVIFTEKAASLGTTGDISFVDLSYYLVGDRQQLQVASSTEFKFNQDKVAFRVISRVDGRPWIQSAITPANSGPTLSPFVQLSSTRT
jgi:HK97 family phage major capsid protein